jgi:mannosyltransferase
LEDGAARRRQAWTNAIPLVFITLAAAALRFHSLAAKSFWLDEAMSVEIARLPWHGLFFDLWHREANMAPYYVLLRPWLDVSSSEGFIRSLSVLFSVATIPVVYALGVRLFVRPAGILAAWFLAINAYHIRYAQEARAYAMVVFFAVLASWLFTKNIHEPAGAHWKTYTAACVLCVYSHFYGGLIVVSHVVSLAFLPPGHADWRKIVRSLVWFSLFVVPIAVLSARAGTAPLDWIPRIDRDTLPSLAILFAGNYGVSLLTLDLAMIGLTALSAIRVWRESGRTVQAWRYGLLFRGSVCHPVSFWSHA